MEGSPSLSASSSATSGTMSTPSSPATSSPGGGSFDSILSAASGGTSAAVPEHMPPRRRLVKAASIIAKREAGATAVAGPPGFGVDRSSGTSPANSIGTGAGPAGILLGVPPPSTSTSNSIFRERTGTRPVIKSDSQGEFLMMPPHLSGGSSGSAKLGRPPFVPNTGIMGDIRPLGRRSEILNSQRRHEVPAVPKHSPDDIRIQQNKRVCLTRAQNMGATGNYKNFDSPFGNYMVPVIPNHLFNKTPASSLAQTPLSNF